MCLSSLSVSLNEGQPKTRQAASAGVPLLAKVTPAPGSQAPASSEDTPFSSPPTTRACHSLGWSAGKESRDRRQRRWLWSGHRAMLSRTQQHGRPDQGNSGLSVLRQFSAKGPETTPGQSSEIQPSQAYWRMGSLFGGLFHWLVVMPINTPTDLVFYRTRFWKSVGASP